MPERTLTHVTSYTPRPPHGRVVQLRLKGTVWAWKCTALMTEGSSIEIYGVLSFYNESYSCTDRHGLAHWPLLQHVSAAGESAPRTAPTCCSSGRASLPSRGALSTLVDAAARPETPPPRTGPASPHEPRGLPLAILQQQRWA